MAQRSTNTRTRRNRDDRSRRTTDRRPSGSATRSRRTDVPRSARATSASRGRASSPVRDRRGTKPAARNFAVDGFRALAIISVLFYHLDVPWLPSGHLGVIMFLVLTGYLVTSSLLRRMREGFGALPHFWVSRFLRIWPPMAVMIALVILTCIIGNHVLLTKARPDILPGLLFFENLSYIIRNVSYFEQIGGPSPLTHLWYLGIDAQFCLIWPFLMLAGAVLPSRSTSRRLTIVLALASAVAMGLLYNPDAGITRVYYGLDTRAFATLLGAWLAYVMPLGKRPARDLRPLIEQGRLVIEILAMVSLVLLVVGMALVPDTSILLYRGGMFLAAVLSCIVLAALVLPGGLLSTVLGLPPLAWLGSRSFGIYLWHYPLIMLLGASSNGAAWWKILLVIVLSLLLGELSYRLIEQPAGRILKPQSVASRRESQLPQAAVLAILAACGIVLLADGVGLALIEPETLVPEDAIVSTGEDAGHAMDMSKRKDSTSDDKSTPEKTEEDIPAADAVLRAPAEEREAGIFDPVLIGDSVPGDAQDYWSAACPDGLLDSYVGRRPDQAVTVLDEYLAQGVVGKIVILQAFSNNPVTIDELDHMIAACGPDRIIYLVNVRIPESEETQINRTIAEAVGKYDNVHLINWNALSEGQPDWIYPDGEHLTPTGQPIYINMLVDAIDEDFSDAGGTITRRNDATQDEGSGLIINSEHMDNPGDGGSAAITNTEASDTTTDDSTATDDSSTDSETTDATDDESSVTDDTQTETASMRILMLGNSFTYYNDMPQMLADITDAEVVTHARGGAILAEQLDANDQMGAQTLAELEAGNWDYVILQEKSSRPIRANADNYIESVTKLADMVRKSGATPIIYATWPYNDDAQRLANMGITRDEMAEQLQTAFKKAEQSSGALVADVEQAFSNARSHEMLYAQDGVHPSVIGSKLAAEIIARTIRDDQGNKAGKSA